MRNTSFAHAVDMVLILYVKSTKAVLIRFRFFFSVRKVVYIMYYMKVGFVQTECSYYTYATIKLAMVLLMPAKIQTVVSMKYTNFYSYVVYIQT